MGHLDANSIRKTSGPAYDKVRPQLDRITAALLAVSPTAQGILTSSYIRFVEGPEAESVPYAVLWVKSSKRVALGLALPEGVDSDLLKPPDKHTYGGLTRYFSVVPGGSVPDEIGEWASLAYQNVQSSQKGTKNGKD
jgi:hypothetical protein